MLKTILSVSGKPGLYRLLSQGPNSTLIVESLLDGKRLPIMPRERVVSLGDITMYTTGDDVTLGEVLQRCYDKHAGKAIDLSALSSSDALRDAFGEVIAEFDRERVYPSDIKKLFSWYNVLVGAGFKSFQAEEGEVEA